jgi:hypothetical protein
MTSERSKIWILGLVLFSLCVPVVFGRTVGNQNPCHIRQEFSSQSVTVGGCVGFLGNPIRVLNQAIGHQHQGIPPDVLPAGFVHLFGFIFYRPRIDARHWKAISWAYERLFRTQSSIIGRQRQILFRIPYIFNDWPPTRNNMGWTFPIIKPVEFKGRVGSHKNGFCNNLHHDPRSFSIYKRFSVKQSSIRVVSGSKSDAFKMFRVSVHNLGLAVKNAPLEAANSDQQPIKNPYCQVQPIPTYRHGDWFTDNYGMFCIICCLPLSALIMVWGGNRIDRGSRWSGRCLIIVGLLLDFTACASGAIGCLPWNWWTCLHDGQEHSQNYDIHNGEYITAFSSFSEVCTSKLYQQLVQTSKDTE